MFEVIILFMGVLLVSYVDIYWVNILILTLIVILILPGIYAMYFGAPLVPSKKSSIKNMLDLGDFKRGDIVVDLGCGDGRVISAVAALGVKRAYGYELSLPTFLLAKLKSIFSGKGEKILMRNFWKQDYGEFDVLICFLLDNRMEDFRRIIWPRLGKGTRVLSNYFKIPGLEPRKREGTVYLYVK